jgi:hypothetical protein
MGVWASPALSANMASDLQVYGFRPSGRHALYGLLLTSPLAVC